MNTSIRELTQRSKTMSVNQMGGGSVQQFFEANKGSLEAVLPRHMSADKMLKTAMTALRTTPGLRECNVASLMGSVIVCAQMGLEPNTPLGHAYLVPFNNKKAGRKEVQVIIGYKGYIHLARNSGEIVSLSGEPVYRREIDEGRFELRKGTDGYIRHEPILEGDAGEIVGFYAVAQFKGDGYQFEYMPRSKVDAIMLASQSGGKYGPWKDHYEEMGRKTPIRRLAKYLPLSMELANAVGLDDAAADNRAQNLDMALEGEYTPIEQGSGESEPEANPDWVQTSPAPENQEPVPNRDPQHESADAYIASMERAESLEALDEVMAYAGDVLSGTEKARATKAFNRNKQRLESGGEQIQF